jgi:hypothetical protein
VVSSAGGSIHEEEWRYIVSEHSEIGGIDRHKEKARRQCKIKRKRDSN